MSRRIFNEGKSPLTQSAEAIKQLIAYQTYGQEPAEMPPFYRLGAEMVLVRSNKGDVYICHHAKDLQLPWGRISARTAL